MFVLYFCLWVIFNGTWTTEIAVIGVGEPAGWISDSFIQPRSPSVLYGCNAPLTRLVIVVVLFETCPVGLEASELTYKSPLITTLSPILYL